MSLLCHVLFFISSGDNFSHLEKNRAEKCLIQFSFRPPCLTEWLRTTTSYYTSLHATSNFFRPRLPFWFKSWRFFASWRTVRKSYKFQIMIGFERSKVARFWTGRLCKNMCNKGWVTYINTHGVFWHTSCKKRGETNTKEWGKFQTRK